MQNKIIAVDFDGTLCLNMYPSIGEPRRMVIKYVLNEQEAGAKLILWTNRTGEQLQEAVDWCHTQGIAFDAVNENLPEIVESFGGDTVRFSPMSTWTTVPSHQRQLSCGRFTIRSP